MISTAPQTQHHSVRRPALFLSPTSANIGHARQSSSPSLPSRLHTADTKPSVPEVRLAVLGALGVGKSGMNEILPCTVDLLQFGVYFFNLD